MRSLIVRELLKELSVMIKRARSSKKGFENMFIKAAEINRGPPSTCRGS